MKKKIQKQPLNIQKIIEKKHYSILLIIVITFIAYFPSLDNDFTNWDDQSYVTENKYIQSLSSNNISYFFSNYYQGNYHPLTMISLAVDYLLAKETAQWYHFHNLFLHILNTLLVFFIVKKLLNNKNNIAFWVSIIFGIHTLHVESVAWISERKDVLYTFFYLLSLLFYLRYTQNKKTNERKFYLLSILAFIFSLLSKGQAVTLSVCLVLIDYFQDRNLHALKIWLEKIPFFVLALIFGLVAIDAQKTSEAIADNFSFHFYERLFLASFGFVQYLLKLVVPYNLSAFYPYPERVNEHLPVYFYLFFVVAAGIVVFWFFNRKKSKELNFGFLFFVATIFPVLQLLPVGSALMADRYAYIPSLGIILILVSGINFLMTKKGKNNPIFKGLIFLYLVFLIIFTQNRVDVWQNSHTLWDDVIEKYPGVSIAWNNKGNALRKDNKKQEAQKHFQKAVSLNPKHTKAWNNLGGINYDLKNYNEAIKTLTKAIEQKNDYDKAYFNRGNAYAALNQFDKAFADYNKALAITPDYVKAYLHRGIVYFKTKKYKEALKDFDTTIKIDKNYYLAYFNRGLVKIFLNKKQEGCADLNTAYQLGYKPALQQMKALCN